MECSRAKVAQEGDSCARQQWANTTPAGLSVAGAALGVGEELALSMQNEGRPKGQQLGLSVNEASHSLF